MRVQNTVENNLQVWDRQYVWREDGDEWDGQARACGQPYETWKGSVVKTFLSPNITSSSIVLEIGPGHGRWSKELAGRCLELILIDLSPNCIQFCRELLSEHDNIRYIVNDGRALMGVAETSVDFIWSFDAFVHMDRETIASYLGEIRRVLKPGAMAIIHHAGRSHPFLWLAPILSGSQRGKHVYDRLTLGGVRETDGWRSNISRELFRGLASKKGLRVSSQVQRWGPNSEFGVPRFGDFVTTLFKT
jgi:SAM-dependent methyltransferase